MSDQPPIGVGVTGGPECRPYREGMDGSLMPTSEGRVRWPFGLYGSGMHDFILRELEIGYRAAAIEDSERCGWSALDDLSFQQYMTTPSRVVSDG